MMINNNSPGQPSARCFPKTADVMSGSAYYIEAQSAALSSTSLFVVDGPAADQLSGL